MKQCAPVMKVLGLREAAIGMSAITKDVADHRKGVELIVVGFMEEDVGRVTKGLGVNAAQLLLTQALDVNGARVVANTLWRKGGGGLLINLRIGPCIQLAHMEHQCIKWAKIINARRLVGPLLLSVARSDRELFGLGMSVIVLLMNPL